MRSEDEAELHRLTGMLAEIDASLPECSPLRESLQKAALATSFAFMDGRREEIEQAYGILDAELSDEQKDYLRSIGIDPDADPTD